MRIATQAFTAVGYSVRPSRHTSTYTCAFATRGFQTLFFLKLIWRNEKYNPLFSPTVPWWWCWLSRAWTPRGSSYSERASPAAVRTSYEMDSNWNSFLKIEVHIIFIPSLIFCHLRMRSVQKLYSCLRNYF